MALAMGERSEKCRKLSQKTNSTLPKASAHPALSKDDGDLYHDFKKGREEQLKQRFFRNLFIRA